MAVAGAVLLLVLLWLLLRTSVVLPSVPPPPDRVAEQGASSPAVRNVSRASGKPVVYRRRPLAMEGGPPGAPIIDKIIVEKDEVCEGEENLVTVLAHTPGNKDDAFLHYTIGGTSGSSVPLRDYGRSREQTEPERRYIQVFGRNGVTTQAEVPYYKVKKCRVGYQVFVNRRKMLNMEDEFEFWAVVRPLDPQEPFVPAYYLWDFGDGTPPKRTNDPMVTHDFGARSQKTYFTQLVVKCTAVDKKGKRVQGRMAFEMLNPHFQTFAFKGVVSLFFRFNPRFPEADERGVVNQRVVVYHKWDDVIIVDKITKVDHYAGGAGSSEPEEVSVTGLLGTDTIPPEGVEFESKLDTEEHPDVFSRNYDVEGHTPEGHPVTGIFSVMQPVRKPTRDNHIPVTDPVLHAKILEARRLLGKEFVTDEDIWRLERLGAFKDLVVDRSKPVRTLLPPPEPPKGRGNTSDEGTGARGPDVPPPPGGAR